MENEDLLDKIIDKLKRLRDAGKNIFGGTFCTPGGDVTLDITIHSEKQYHICYCCGGIMYNWLIDKEKMNCP